jgi:hypothetical protein
VDIEIYWSVGPARMWIVVQGVPYTPTSYCYELRLRGRERERERERLYEYERLHDCGPAVHGACGILENEPS